MECLSILLQQGADPHLVDFNGDTALHHAVSRGNIRIASELLDYKADINTKTQHGLTPYQLALNEHQHEMAEFLVRNGANIPLELQPNREEAAAKHPEQTKCTSFIKASRRLKDQVSLREGPAAEQPEQKKKKHVTFNEEVHYNTDMKPFSSAVTPPGELKSLLKKSVDISGDNGRIKDELSPGLSKNPDIPASPPVDKASTSAIKEDIEQSSSRIPVEDSTSSYAGDRGDNLQEPEKITVHITTLDHTHSLGDASDPPQNINECFSDANSAGCTLSTVNTCSEFLPGMSVLLLASVIWFQKCVALAMALVGIIPNLDSAMQLKL
ncbi:Ankyrin repeat domain-containing protein 26, partial [Lemmus lemmus]